MQYGGKILKTLKNSRILIIYCIDRYQENIRISSQLWCRPESQPFQGRRCRRSNSLEQLAMPGLPCTLALNPEESPKSSHDSQVCEGQPPNLLIKFQEYPGSVLKSDHFRCRELRKLLNISDILSVLEFFTSQLVSKDSISVISIQRDWDACIYTHAIYMHI